MFEGEFVEAQTNGELFLKPQQTSVVASNLEHQKLQLWNDADFALTRCFMNEGLQLL
jgi:hypothetical protein